MPRANRNTAPAAPQVETPPTPPAENLPAIQENRSLAPVNQRNAFESYGDQASQRSSIVGDLLKFSKGEWTRGQDEDEVEEGTKFVCNMDQLMVGWVKWVDNKPEQQIMGPVAEGYQPPRRDTLGDMDDTQWELDQNDKPRDPWQLSNYIVMKTPGEPATDVDNMFTFATSSKGGIGAIGELCKRYGKEMRNRPDHYPIVEIGVDSYKHSNPQYGKIYTPTFTIVGWEEKSLFEGTPSASEPEPEPAPTRRAAAGNSRRR